MPNNKNLVPNFIGRPDPEIRVTEGSGPILLRCQVDRAMEFASWLKVGREGFPMPILGPPNMSRQSSGLDRFVFTGDMSRGDYSMEIKSIALSDSGQYSCQVRPEDGTDYNNPDDYIIRTNITVLRQPPQLVNGGANGHQQAHSLTAQSSSSSSSSEITAATDGADPSLEMLVSADKTKHNNENGRNAQSQLHARGIPPSWTKLSSSPSLAAISSSSSSSSMQPSAFINSHPSHSNMNYPAVRASTSPNGLSASTSASLALAWPYLLLALAFFLMMANIYLIYSLIKRHTSCSSSSSGSSAADLEEQTTTSSNNSGSGGGGGGGNINNNNNNLYPYPPHHHTNSILKRPRNS